MKRKENVKFLRYKTKIMKELWQRIRKYTSVKVRKKKNE